MRHQHDALLTETIARHFPDARIVANEIDLGFAGLHIACSVNAVHELGPYKSASLFFTISSADLRLEPTFASISGYAESAEAAIVTGACNWACAFGPVLRASVGDGNHENVERFEISVDGQAFRVYVDGVDRAMLFKSSDESEVSARVAAARKRHGASPWLAPLVLRSGQLPLLSPDRRNLLSVFVADRPDGRVLEIKVNGRDWPVTMFKDVPLEPAGAVTLLRELAILVPVGERAALTRAPVLRTLDGVRAEPGDRNAVTWPGWRTHGGALEEPAADADIDAIEGALGPLPPDYRAFLASVGTAGAGPGYGLLPPTGESQRILARGTFAWADETEPNGAPAGSIALAHAGCGVIWLLVLNGPSRGEVWVDARSSDGHVRRVAPSFDAWYRRWLEAAVRDGGPWSQWNAACCATPSVLSQLLNSIQKEGLDDDAAVAEVPKRLKPGAIKLLSGGSPYFAEQQRLAPCQPCVAMAARLGLGSDVFALHEEPQKAPGEPSPGLLARVSSWFRMGQN